MGCNWSNLRRMAKFFVADGPSCTTSIGSKCERVGWDGMEVF